MTAVQAAALRPTPRGDHPRLLFFAHLVPWPPDAGAPIRTWHLLKELARDYRVDGVFLSRGHAARDEAALDRLAAHCAPTIVRLAGADGTRAAIARSLVSGRPYTRYLNHSADAADRLRSLLAMRRHALVHVDSLDLVGYLPLLHASRRREGARPPVVVGHHAVESEMLERRGALASSRLEAMLFAHQAHLLRRAETLWCARVQLNLCVSQRDARELERRAPGARTAVAPNGVDVDYFRPTPERGGREIVFIGGADWAPNRDAARFFAQEIGPALEDDAGAELVCIGRAHPDAANLPGVRWTGRVPDIRPHLARAGVVIVPLRVGGGTRLKILTAWASGKPVVSTRLGAEGLDARAGENILIADTPRDFAQAIAALRGDPAAAARLASAGRATVERHYDWRIVGRGLRSDYDALLRAP